MFKDNNLCLETQKLLRMEEDMEGTVGKGLKTTDL